MADFSPDAQWYYMAGGQQFGPVPLAQLKQLAQAGQLRPDSLIWKNGLLRWMEAGSLAGVFSPRPAGASEASPVAAGAATQQTFDAQPLPALLMSPQSLGMAPQVRVVAVLMIVQGALEACVAGMILFTMVLGLVMASANPRHKDMPGWVFVAVLGGIALPIATVAALRIVAGIRNLKYRSRKLGIVAMCCGALTALTGYCALTSIGLLIYGLIVYLQNDVKEAFAQSEQAAAEEKAALDPWTSPLPPGEG